MHPIRHFRSPSPRAAWALASGTCLLAAIATAQTPPERVPARVPGAAVEADAPSAIEQAQALGFMPALLRYHSGDALPDIALLAADGSETMLSAQRGEATVVVLLPGIGGDGRTADQQRGARTIAERYAPYAVKTLVVGAWMAKDEFLAAARAHEAAAPYPVFGDPVGPYRGPGDDQDARMAHHKNTLLGRMFGGGMTPPLPAAFVVDAEGKLVGSFRPSAEPPFEGIANLLLRAGIALAPEDMPSAVAPASVWVKPAPRPAESPVQLVAVGSVAADFEMRDADGEPVRLSDFAGKVVVLDFWATWCGPCRAALPHVQEVAAKYAEQGVVVIASCTSDSRKAFLGFVAEQAAKYPNVRFAHDPLEKSVERASRALYGVSGIPQQFVIGRDGKIAGSVDGYMAGEVLLDAALAEAGIEVDPEVLEAAKADRAKRESRRGTTVPATPLKRGG